MPRANCAGARSWEETSRQTDVDVDMVGFVVWDFQPSTHRQRRSPSLRKDHRCTIPIPLAIL